jgi:hypothetical protein
MASFENEILDPLSSMFQDAICKFRSIEHPASSIEYRESSIEYQVSSIEYHSFILQKQFSDSDIFHYWRATQELFPELKKMVHRSVSVTDSIVSAGPDGVLDVGFGFAYRIFDIIALGHITGDC